MPSARNRSICAQNGRPNGPVGRRAPAAGTIAVMPCARHPEVEASHACTLCGVFHCEACLRPVATPGRARPMLTCPDCGGLARVAMERIPTAREDMIDLLRRPFDSDGLISVLVLAAPLVLTAIPVLGVPTFAALLHGGALASYYFQTIDHIGRGLPGLPFSAAPVSRWEIAGALVRGLACLAVVAGPASVASVYLPEATVFIGVLLLLGLALAPAAILAVAVTGRARAALWPLTWARLIARAPAAYGRLVLLFAASSAVWLLGLGLGVATAGHIPLFGMLAAGALNALLAVIQAVLVGGFLRRNALELGYA
jgi:hypothetical protein